MGLFTIGYTLHHASKSPSLHRTELPSRFDHFSFFPIICFPLLCCLFLSDAKRFKSESLNQNVGIYSTSYQPCQKRHLPPKMPKTSVLSTCTSSKNLDFFDRDQKKPRFIYCAATPEPTSKRKSFKIPVTSCSRLQQWKVP